LAGLKTNPFEEVAITAIQQGSGGLFRKANHLARDALIAAAQQSLSVSAEHVRLAAK
jgi:general secretion pathway protein A